MFDLGLKFAPKAFKTEKKNEKNDKVDKNDKKKESSSPASSPTTSSEKQSGLNLESITSQILEAGLPTCANLIASWLVDHEDDISHIYDYISNNKEEKVTTTTKSHENELSEEESKLKKEGERDGYLFSSLIIRMVFYGKIKKNERSIDVTKFVDQSIIVLFSEFKLPYEELNEKVKEVEVDSFGNVVQEIIIQEKDQSKVKGKTLTTLSNEISEKILSNLQLNDNSELKSSLAKTLRTLHHELLVKANKSDDLKEDLIEELKEDFQNNNINFGEGSLKEILNLSIKRVINILKGRYYSDENDVKIELE